MSETEDGAVATGDARLFVRLAPVLNVRDLAEERSFWERLGLPVTCPVHLTRSREADQ